MGIQPRVAQRPRETVRGFPAAASEGARAARQTYAVRADGDLDRPAERADALQKEHSRKSRAKAYLRDDPRGQRHADLPQRVAVGRLNHLHALLLLVRLRFSGSDP